MATNAPPREGAVDVRFLPPCTVEVIFSGRLTRRLLEDSATRAHDLAYGKRFEYSLTDCSAITSVDPDIRHASTRHATEFQSSGGKGILVVLSFAPLRMLASAVAFAAGMPIKLFSTRAEAAAWLRGQGALP